MAEYKKNPNEIGALWKKVSKNANPQTGKKTEYLSGIINGVNVTIFKNQNKPAGSKGPDYQVLKSDYNGGNSAKAVTPANVNPPTSAVTKPKTTPVAAPAPEPVEEEFPL